MQVLGPSVISKVGTSEMGIDRRGAGVIRWFAGNRNHLFQHRNKVGFSTRPIGPDFSNDLLACHEWEFLDPVSTEESETVRARLFVDPEPYAKRTFAGFPYFFRMDFTAENRCTGDDASLSLCLTVQNLKEGDDYIFTSGLGIQVLVPFAAGMVIGSDRTDKKQFHEPPVAVQQFTLMAKARWWGDPAGMVRINSIPIVYPDRTLLFSFGPETDILKISAGAEDNAFIALTVFSSRFNVKTGMARGISCGLSMVPGADAK